MKQGEKTKLFILDAANQLFYQQGYSSTSLADIVEKTDLSKGNITYHFKSKKDILGGVVSQRLLSIEARLESWNQEFEDVIERLMRFCEVLVNEQENLKQFGCPMGTLIGEFSKNESALYEVSLPMMESFKHWLTQQFELLGYSNQQAEDYAMELLARTQGISMLTHVFKDAEFLNREVNKLKRAIDRSYRQ